METLDCKIARYAKLVYSLRKYIGTCAKKYSQKAFTSIYLSIQRKQFYLRLSLQLSVASRQLGYHY